MRFSVSYSLVHSFLFLRSGSGLDALSNCPISWVCIFRVTAGDVRQLIRISFPVHWVGEILTVRGLSHRGTPVVAHSSCAALNAWILGAQSCNPSNTCRVRVRSWSFGGAALVDPLPLIILAVLDRGWRIHTHEVAQIRIVSGSTWLPYILCGYVGIALARHTWIAWNVAWVVRVAWGLSMSVAVLRVVQIARVWWLSRGIICRSWHIGFLPRLRTDPPKSSKPWTSLIIVVITYWLAISVDTGVVIWIQIIVILDVLYVMIF